MMISYSLNISNIRIIQLFEKVARGYFETVGIPETEV